MTLAMSLDPSAVADPAAVPLPRGAVLEVAPRAASDDLPVTAADRRSAVLSMLAAHPELSDREIARRTGSSPGTVSRLRPRGAGPGGECPPESAERRLGRDGRMYSLARGERWQLVEDYFQQQPAASIREAAAALGMPASTVHNVRAAIARDAQPPVMSRRVRKPRRPVRPAPEDPARLLDRLSADPALRRTEAGRSLLQLLHAVHRAPSLLRGAEQAVPEYQHEAMVALMRHQLVELDAAVTRFAGQRR